MKQKYIILNERRLPYIIRRHRRAKHLRLTVNCDANVICTVPLSATLCEAELFLRRKAEWILDQVRRLQGRGTHWCCRGSRGEYLAQRQRAQEIISKKVAELNTHYGFSVRSINIRNQKTRWGSCSARGNLNFNYRLIFLKEQLLDYVVVHELCHLRQPNHSANFWALVAETVPDCWERRRELLSKK